MNYVYFFQDYFFPEDLGPYCYMINVTLQLRLCGLSLSMLGELFTCLLQWPLLAFFCCCFFLFVCLFLDTRERCNYFFCFLILNLCLGLEYNLFNFHS